jgi:hypothetical protein
MVPLFKANPSVSWLRWTESVTIFIEYRRGESWLNKQVVEKMMTMRVRNLIREFAFFIAIKLMV